MKKLFSLVALISMIVSGFMPALPALAQPVAIDADVTVRLLGLLESTGSPRTLVIKAGSDATQYVVNLTNIVITTERNAPIKIWDLGRGSNGVRRIINNNASPLIPTSCIDEGSQLYITTPNDSQVISVTPGDEAVTCSVSNTGSGGSGGGGGGGGGSAPAPSTPTPTTQPTTQTVTVFKDGKLVQVSPEEAAKLKAAEAAAPKAAEPVVTPSQPSAAAEAPARQGENAPAVDPVLVGEARAEQITRITTVEAPAVASANTITEYAQNVGVARNEVSEGNVITNIISKVNIDFSGLLGGKASGSSDKVVVNAAAFERAVGFITYGTQSTQIGEGERAGVLNSYIAAYGKAPTTDAEWSDLLKIASGRFPTEKCSKTADRGAVNFQRTYGRAPSAKNANDQAAMNMMTCGLLPVKTVLLLNGKAKVVPNRDTKKEKQAILIFKKKFGFNPKAATAWNVVRAIGYSGVAVK